MTVLNEGTYARILDSYRSMAYATLTCNGKACTHLSCSDVSNPTCQKACGNSFTSEIANCKVHARGGKPNPIPSGVGTVKQVAPEVLGTSTAPSQRLSPQDQDCANFGGSGLNAALFNIPEQFCVAGKSITKGIKCPPQLGSLCNHWMLILLGAGAFAIYFVVKKIR